MTTSVDNDRSLAGRRVVVTRAAAQSEALREALTARGADVVICPVLRIEAADVDAPALDRYRWIVFTSRNAVRQFRSLLVAAGGTPTLPADIRVAVVGPGTAAALAVLGREPDLVADPPTGAGLAATFATVGLPAGTAVLRVRGDLAPTEVEDELARIGAVVDVLTAYHTRTVAPPAEALAAVRQGAIDAVTFFSSSAVQGFEAGLPEHGLHSRAYAACVGPVTAAAAQAAGWRCVITAAEPAAPALAATLAAALATSA